MENIFFDLDGTIIDSELGVVSSVIYAAKDFGIDITDRAPLRVFIGPPLDAMFKKYFNFTDEESAKAVAKYRERYREIGVYENKLYDGIEDMLKSLKNAGKTLCLATSKPEVFARKILEQHGITEYFTEITGASLDGKIATKAQVITELLRRLNITDACALMVGDTYYDVLGAKEFGMDCLAVTYGFGTEEELKKAGAKYIVHSTDEITKVILAK